MTFLNRANQSFLTHARLWYLVDAKDQINGRLAAYLGQILQGKTKPIYHHQDDVGDHVVVINTRHIILTGSKWKKKLYRHHTGYPGGLKAFTARDLHERDATRILWRAVYGMLPKNNLRPIWMKRLHLFEESEHPFAENIFAKLEGPAPLPKRLEEFTLEEIENYPKLFWAMPRIYVPALSPVSHHQSRLEPQLVLLFWSSLVWRLHSIVWRFHLQSRCHIFKTRYNLTSLTEV